MLSFEFPPADTELAERVKTFVRDAVIPFEKDPRNGYYGPDKSLRTELNALARSVGLLAPHVGAHYGGMGLSHAQRSAVFERLTACRQKNALSFCEFKRIIR